MVRTACFFDLEEGAWRYPLSDRRQQVPHFFCLTFIYKIMEKWYAMFEKMRKDASLQDIQQIGAKLKDMNRGQIAKIWDEVMALWRFMVDPKAPWQGKAIAIAALLYLVSPLDVVPDFLPVIGLGDDVAVILFAIKQLGEDLKKYRQ